MATVRVMNRAAAKAVQGSSRRGFAVFAAPGESGAPYQFKPKYDNFIGGKWTPPVKGDYFEVTTPTTGKVFTSAARGTGEDVEAALDAAHKASAAWGSTPAAARSNLLLKIADAIDANLERLAYVETIDNGKPIRETINADIPLAADHFRYFASVLRSQEGSISQLDEHTHAYHLHEPLGVVGQIIPWNFPILMAAWKLAPALAAGNAVVLKPAESTPISIMVLFELIGSILPPGVVNIVNGFGREAGSHLANSKRISKIAFTGSTAVGKTIAIAAAQNLIPATLELGGKSPNIFFEDVMAQDDDYFDKALEGLALFAFNSGEVCTCPSRALIQESIYEKFMERAVKRVAAIKLGTPLDTATQLGAQNSKTQFDKILRYIDIGKQEGAQVLTGGGAAKLPGALGSGYYIQPTMFKGHNKMKIFQEEIFGPVLAVTTFKTEEEAMKIANDTPYGLGAGVWTRDINRAHRFGKGIQAGRVWINNYHAYPAHAAFGGYKESGLGRETYLTALNSYQQTKNLLTSYSPKALGFF